MFWKLVFSLTQPPKAPILQVAAYYLVLAAAGGALLHFLPGHFALAPHGGIESAPALGEVPLFDMSTSARAGVRTELAVLVALSGTLLFTLPLSWTYMGTRRKKGVDQSVAQTIVILPIAVAGIVVVVQDSIALAFSLAGIVAAVRFRTTLKRVSDALYIFAAIGIGLACGVGAIGVGGVISAFFNFAILILWHCDYATCSQVGPLPEFASGRLLEKARAQGLMEVAPAPAAAGDDATP